MAEEFDAPWTKLLWGVTGLSTVVLWGVSLGWLGVEDLPTWARGIGGICVLIWAVCALFMVRGYRLEGSTLFIKRLYWETEVSLEGLVSVRHDNKLMKGALRVGNGGLFVFAGWYWSKQHGWFHLAGNDILGRAVLLETPRAKWMITPGDPQRFLAVAEGLIGEGG